MPTKFMFLKFTQLIRHAPVRLGHKSVFGGFAFGMREEDVPAAIAAERFQADQGLVPDLTPKLSDAFEAALVLPAGGFNRFAAQRFITLLGGASRWYRPGEHSEYPCSAARICSRIARRWKHTWAEKFTRAREALNTLSDRYLEPLRERFFERPPS
jgi:uncharacterized protein YjiS (DUF1127 family)